MNVANKKIKLFVTLSVLLSAAGLVFADGMYKNNVVDLKINKESGTTVKVTIYTDKPYSEPIVVNKKANNKYVILMPETKSSMKSEPSVLNAAGTISSVSVNTQDVSSGQGYTKIIITSQKAVTIIPTAQQLSTSQAVAAEQSAARETKQAVQKRAELQKAEQNKDNKTAAVQKSKCEIQKQTVSQNAGRNRQRKAVPQKEEHKKAMQTVVKPQNNTLPVQPIKVLEQEINTGKNAKFVSDNEDSVLKKEIKENTEKSKHILKNNNVLQETNNKQSLIENLKTVLKDYKNISIWKLLLLIGAIAFPLVVIVIILGLDKRINRRIDKSFPKENVGAGEPLQSSIQEQSCSSFDTPLDKADMQASPHPKERYNEEKSLQYAQSVLQSEITNMAEENLKKEEVPEEETVKEEPAAENIAPKPEFEEDFETTDFEHDFEETNNENKLPQEDELPEIPAHETAGMEPYSPDGYLADFANISDKEFFDELVLQSLADSNSAGLPDESPADEVFNLLRDEEIKTQNPSLNDGDSEFSKTIWSEEPKNVAATVQTSNDNFVAAAHGNNLTMLTEVKLDDNTGFYLVNYENFSSLVGHINDDYFVIKKFDDIMSGNIILKQTEKLKNSARYMVRVGKNKMVVEVSPTSINKLLDL